MSSSSILLRPTLSPPTINDQAPSNEATKSQISTVIGVGGGGVAGELGLQENSVGGDFSMLVTQAAFHMGPSRAPVGPNWGPFGNAAWVARSRGSLCSHRTG